MFKKENIFLVDKKLTKIKLFEMFSKLGKQLGVVKDEKVTLDAIKSREAMGTTGFTHGFAIPHCLSDNVITPTLLVAKLDKPIMWGEEDGNHSLDGKPISFVFCLLITNDGGSIHLNFLKQIARSLMNEDFRNSILKASTIDQIYKEINKLLES